MLSKEILIKHTNLDFNELALKYKKNTLAKALNVQTVFICNETNLKSVLGKNIEP